LELPPLVEVVVAEGVEEGEEEGEEEEAGPEQVQVQPET